MENAMTTHTTAKQPDTTPEQNIDKLASDAAAMPDVLALCRTADVHPVFPMSSETVAEVMDGNQYVCTVDTVRRYLDEKIVPCPDRINGRLSWTPRDVLMLCWALEFRRAWKPFSQFHDHKKNRFETLQQLAELHGADGCFVDLKTWDVGGLLTLLLEPACDLGARAAIVVALKTKLAEKGIEV